jgi:uncharacterized protein (TIGR03382 family)
LRRGTAALAATLALGAAGLTAPALAQWTPPTLAIPPADGGMFQWATVGALNNPAYTGTPNTGPGSVSPQVLGRGSVGYAFRISRNELRTSDLVAFYQALYGSTDPAVRSWATQLNQRAWINQGSFIASGVLFATPFPDGRANVLLRGPAYANVPARLSWREAALFCNWMHNDRGLGQVTGPAVFSTGAYDTSTWLDLGGTAFADAPTRMNGARFWIPNLDETLKAGHYDPNRFGPGQGGYWLYGTSSDAAPVFGQPGTLGPGGVPSNALVANDTFFGGPLTTVGMFPGTQSPWGLLDVAGGWAEWVEEPADLVSPGSRLARSHLPGGANMSAFAGYLHFGSQFTTLRIASAIPTPSAASAAGLLLVWVSRRRR